MGLAVGNGLPGFQKGGLAFDVVEGFCQKYGPEYVDEERRGSWSYRG